MKKMDHWFRVKVPRKNLYNWADNLNEVGNHVHYLELKNWCFEHFPKKQWGSYLDKDSCEKIFLFEKEKYVTMFLLAWPL